MAEYGIEVRDESGNIILDNKHLTHRLWHWGIYSKNTTITYSTPLNHEPTIVVMGIGGYADPVEHVKSGSQFTGFRVKQRPIGTVDKNLVVVFIRE